MPPVVHRSPWRTALCAAVAIASLAAPSIASACTVPNSAESQPFLGVGDPSSYIPAPGGTFDNGASGWTLHDATVQSDTVAVAGVDFQGTGSLQIAADGSAVSPPVCVDLREPTIRFLERSGASGTAGLSVDVVWNLLGIPLPVPVGVLASSPSWSASPIYPLAAAAPTTLIGQTVPARIAFHAVGGPVRLDGLFVDPYTRG